MKKIILFISVITALSCNSVTQSKSEPVNVVAPESQPPGLESFDSSFLKLKINSSHIEVSLQNKSTIINDLKKLDSFLQSNISRIDTQKVAVGGFDTTKNNTEFTGLLKKFGIYRFSIATELKK